MVGRKGKKGGKVGYTRAVIVYMGMVGRISPTTIAIMQIEVGGRDSERLGKDRGHI